MLLYLRFNLSADLVCCWIICGWCGVLQGSWCRGFLLCDVCVVSIVLLGFDVDVSCTVIFLLM